MKRLILMLGALLSMPLPAADDAVNRVLDCMRANIPQTVRIQEVEITTVDRSGGERRLHGRLYGKRENGLVRAMLKIDAPHDLAGAAYLVREGRDRDDMYMYLPALNKVRRITGGNADTPLLGTDLSYNDVKQMENAYSGGRIELEPPADIEDRPVYVLALTPRAETASRYNLVRAWVDQKTCVALKVEFYESGSLRKRLSASPNALKQAGAHWYLTDMQMRDLKESTQTMLRVLGVTGGDKLSDRYFNANSFYLGS